jgi:subtilisin family serine protease
MKSKYDVMMMAGSRINGLDQFGSEAEKSHYERDLESLIAELGNDLVMVHHNLGFLTVDLTEAQAQIYAKDARIYSIIKTPETVPRVATSYDVSVEQNWALRLLSNTGLDPYKIICGFELDMTTQTYGSNPSFSVGHEIRLTSTINKLTANGQAYDMETVVPRLLASVCWLSNLESPFYVGGTFYACFDLTSNMLMFLDRSDVLGTVALYSVDVQLYDDPIILAGTQGVAVVGFSNLKPLPRIEWTYRCVATGAGVDLIVSDSQLNYSQSEFGGRARIAYNPYADTYQTAYGDPFTQTQLLDTHGTEVASAAAGLTCGVAKEANILGVTTLDLPLDDRPREAREIEALAWILDYVMHKIRPVVVNISWGTASVYAPYDSAVAAIVAEGGIVCIASGNDNSCVLNSPYAEGALFVAASDRDATPTDFSHYGSRIDLYAPGKNVRLVDNYGMHQWANGTSFAAPYVAGLCALWLSLYPDSTSAETKTVVLAAARSSITNNKLDTTDVLAGNPAYGYTLRSTMSTPPVDPKKIYVVTPFFVDFSGEYMYGETLEFTASTLTSVTVSAGRAEAKDVAVLTRLVP